LNGILLAHSKSVIRNFKPKHPSDYAAWVVFIIQLILLIYAIPRGFDFSDEGYYALIADPYQQHRGSPIQMNLFFKLFHEITGVSFGLIDLRVLRLMLYILASIYLIKIIKALYFKPLGIHHYSFAWTTIVAGYSFLPQSLSYNHLTSVISIFLVFYGIRKYYLKQLEVQDSWKISLLLTLLIYIKPTTAFLFLAFYLLLELLANRKRFLFSVCKPLIVFSLSEMIFYWVIGENFYFNVLTQESVLLNRTSYQLLFILKTLVVGCMWSVLLLLSGYLVWKGKNSIGVFKLSFFSLGVLMFLLILNQISIADESVFVIAGFFLLGIGSYFMQTFQFLESKQRYLMILFFLLPFMLHAGSNVYFLRQVNQFAWAWSLLLLFLIPAPQFKKITLIFVAIFTLIIFDGLIYRPFGQSSLWNQTIEWEYQAQTKSILISEKAFHELSVLKRLILENNIQSDELIAFFRNPGYLYLIDYQMPRISNLWEKSQLSLINWSDIRLVVLSNHESIPEVLIKDFSLVLMPDHSDLSYSIYLKKEQ